MQRLYGIDFTSAPRRAKPLVVAEAILREGGYHVQAVHRLTDFAAFDTLLATPGPWLAGCDFPFGQPRAFWTAQGWGQDPWPRIIERLATWTMADWLAALAAFRAARPPGQKQPLRVTDARAGALSPMMAYGVPVARMFWRGAPRLWTAGVSILPCAPRDDPRQVVEIYPGHLARAILGKQPYKHERGDDPARQAARQTLLQALQARGLRWGDDVASAALHDPRGDVLDALLAVAQLVTALDKPGYGIPAEADPLEGWIVGVD